MRLGTFLIDDKPIPGIVSGEQILAIPNGLRKLERIEPFVSLLDVIAAGQWALDRLDRVLHKALHHTGDPELWQPLADTRALAPIPRPAKNVFCVGRNYKAHIEEGARARGREFVFPTAPEFFSKPPTAVIGHDADIFLDQSVTSQLDYEVELAMVIGQTCRNLNRTEARQSVFGYTIVNDISARDLQKNHGQWFKGKGLDTSCPMGPWIVTSDEFGGSAGHRITLRVNGTTRQDSCTSDLLFTCDMILESLSAGITLESGDIIATGTPSGVALGMTPQQWLRPGDVVEAEIEGIGTLRNYVLDATQQ